MLLKIDNAPWPTFPYKPEVTAKVTSTATHLWVEFSVKEDNIRAVYTDDLGQVWTDSCVEVFVATADGQGYVNVETNCIGTVYAARHTNDGAEICKLTPDELGQISRIGSLPHEKTDICGEALEWTMKVGIPFSLYGFDEAPKSIRCNLYKCGDNTQRPHFLSWAPINLPQPCFHCPQFFAELAL